MTSDAADVPVDGVHFGGAWAWHEVNLKPGRYNETRTISTRFLLSTKIGTAPIGG